ncbi:hypothetical protein ES705_44253 [subsurface metagenome]
MDVPSEADLIVALVASQYRSQFELVNQTQCPCGQITTHLREREDGTLYWVESISDLRKLSLFLA